MIDLIIAKFHDQKFLTMALAAVAAIATVLTLAMPLLSTNARHPDEGRVSRAREDPATRTRTVGPRRKGKGQSAPIAQAVLSRVVERFNLTKLLAQEAARDKLVQAGFRGQAPYVAFLFFRMVTPAVLLLFSLFYLFVVVEWDQPATVKVGLCLGAAYAGMHLPFVFLKNGIAKRQLSIKRAFPDALDLLLICVESGMSVEAAFRKVSEEIGSQSIPLAEELTLTTAELSYLQDRRMAYENLAKRTDSRA